MARYASSLATEPLSDSGLFDPLPHLTTSLRKLSWLVAFTIVNGLAAEPIRFKIYSQPVLEALAEFTAQSGVEIIYAPDQFEDNVSTEVRGKFEPGDALVRLLRKTDFTVVLQNGLFVVTRLGRPRGELAGTVIPSNGESNSGTLISIPELGYRALTNRHGEFHFDRVPFGLYTLTASRDGFQPIRVETIHINSTDVSFLSDQTLRPLTGATELEAFVVTGALNRYGPLDPGPTIWGARRAGGNLDLNRSVSDALPFLIYDRDRINRSGAVNLNDFLRTELLDTDATALPPNQDSGSDLFTSGSSNLNLRGFGAEETVVLVNGRRLPQVLTAIGSVGNNNGFQAPDVNFIPLSLVQQVQVLPASASALYSGNAVGGVINILLRPVENGRHSEVTTTYTNATEGFDAPYSSISFLHSESLLDGKLNLRINANFVSTKPAIEADLKFQRDHASRISDPEKELFGATPNIRAIGANRLIFNTQLKVTSVPEGADGTAGLAAFAGRENLRNFDQYDSPGTVADGTNGVDLPYGREQERSLFFASAIYEVTPWLEISADAFYSHSRTTRGYNVFTDDLDLRRNNPLSPFDHDVKVSLFETPVALGQDYHQAQTDIYSMVASALVQLPHNWTLIGDTQFAQSTTKFRGIADVDTDRWNDLIARGIYNPLRDTQVFAPPPEFYDEVIIFTGARDQFVTLGDYESTDAALRLTNDSWELPTGKSVFNFGADYRITSLGNYLSERRYGDGTLQRFPERWEGRQLERVSVFTELQAPLVPRHHLPAFISTIEADVAARYIAADTSAESNLAPTIALKIGLTNGLTFRGSFTTSNRFPTPFMSRNRGNGIAGGTGVRMVEINDPRRNERYQTEQVSVLNPNLRSENAVTQTLGLVYQFGEQKRFRASLDFFDTRKTNEIFGLGPTELLNLESSFPQLVVRENTPGEIGQVTELRTGAFNLASRHSQNLMATFDFAQRDVFGGTLDLRARAVYFSRFERQILPGDSTTDELRDPSGATGILQYRATFGGSWSVPHFAFGLDGQYFHSRRLPQLQWVSQGARTIDPFWQADLYAQADLGHWLLPEDSHLGLKAQVRINNAFKNSYPAYAGEASGAGVQPYGDWRGRTISVSLKAEF